MTFDRWMKKKNPKYKLTDDSMMLRALRDAYRAGELAEQERICGAIKAEDGHCSTGEYMLDADDCISVARGTWQRPDYTLTPNAKVQPASEASRACNRLLG